MGMPVRLSSTPRFDVLPMLAIVEGKPVRVGILTDNRRSSVLET